MLGTRTKQVLSYGRRGRRIVNVTERRDVFDDENAKRLKTVSAPAVKVLIVERDASPLVDSPPPKPPRRTRRKRISSPLTSPQISAKPKAVRRVIDSHDVSPRYNQSSASGRRPLGLSSPNVPRPTSASLVGKKKPISSLSKGTSLRPLHSPEVEVDIIILDDNGRRLSHERRVSKFDKPPLPRVSKSLLSRKSNTRTEVIVLTDSEDELPPTPEPTRRPVQRRNIDSISSDESDEDITIIDIPSTTTVSASSSVVIVERPAKPVGQKGSLLSHSNATFEIPILPNIRLQKPPDVSVLPSSLSYTKARDVPLPHSPPPTRSRPRQLTPIRRGRPNFLQPPSPVSPTTPSDFDLSLDFADLSITSDVDDVELAAQPPHLCPLLTECGQAVPHEFSAFIKTFPYDPIVRSSDDFDEPPPGRQISFQKIGEASYSEVFGIGDVVLKVIPIRDEDAALELDVEGPAPSDAKDVLKEMIVTKAMGDMCDGFVKLLRTYVVRGKYPSLLLSLWDEYNDRKGSESIRPDMFTGSQVYAIIVLPNGGPDLEAFTFAQPTKTGWRQAASLFWQVVRTLAEAEDLVSFEHRDLHWGQILVKNIPSIVPQQRSGVAMGKLPMDTSSSGVKATVIDLGLARMDSVASDGTSMIRWTPFDQEIFEGEGDYQFDVYRLMREHNDDDWEQFRPLSNVMWLHYLALKLLDSKRLRAPRKTTSAKPSAGYTERECYDCLVEMQALLSKSLEVFKKPASRKGRRKTQAPTRAGFVSEPKSAVDVFTFGVESGWVRA
ncbi:hypothetical protein BV25DRAFT_1817426 [Artomyces pyxidatus]|uniref:Uncharacterized protein n=1 Tax=Artomyces pyxidatus TaxID=48021 RepID=A0ACB8TJJ3_9AGAM|nr:hypothetical protein BV25DRAFT_1817426 [Artomyces pyxidatus]